MTKLLYNGEYTELEETLEPGYKELDLIVDEDNTTNNLEDTLELKPINLEDTKGLKVLDLEDTQYLDLGETDEQ